MRLILARLLCNIRRLDFVTVTATKYNFSFNTWAVACFFYFDDREMLVLCGVISNVNVIFSARTMTTFVMQDRNPMCFLAVGCEEESVSLARSDL